MRNLLVLFAFAFLMAACGGTDTGNPQQNQSGRIGENRGSDGACLRDQLTCDDPDRTILYRQLELDCDFPECP